MGESMACEESLTHKEEQLFSSCKITGTNTNHITDQEKRQTQYQPHPSILVIFNCHSVRKRNHHSRS
jgi:hypothetical protein